MAVVGPNGAGKSSLLRIAAGLLRPSSGVLEVVGEDGDGRHYLGHQDALKPTATLGETLAFWAALFCAERPRPDTIRAAADRVGLAHALQLPAGILSAGQRRRAGLARLVIAPRPVWVLDEPAAALDRDGVALIGSLLQEHLAGGGMAIIATHDALPVSPGFTIDLLERR